MSEYSRFEYQKSYTYQSGWDAFALEYEHLLKPNTVYTLTKEVMYQIVEHHVTLKPGMKVLDVNCGTGNDFPYFLSKGCHVTGCDISAGMLNKAYETYSHEIKSGKIELYQGALENMTVKSFTPQSFDVIYSITGGFSYIDHVEMERVFKYLKQFLKPDGKIITAHFGRFALAEWWFYFRKGQFNMAWIRRKSKLNVPIKNQIYVMHLQRYQWLEKIFRSDFVVDGIHPLLFFTPPYQTKFTPDSNKLQKYKEREFKAILKKRLANFSDQFVIVLSKK